MKKGPKIFVKFFQIRMKNGTREWVVITVGVFSCIKWDTLMDIALTYYNFIYQILKKVKMCEHSYNVILKQHCYILP